MAKSESETETKTTYNNFADDWSRDLLKHKLVEVVQILQLERAQIRAQELKKRTKLIKLTDELDVLDDRIKRYDEVIHQIISPSVIDLFDHN